MIQLTTVLLRVTVGYDDETTTERQAQDRLLDALPSGGRVHHAEIVGGLVDHDGAQLQPKVSLR